MRMQKLSLAASVLAVALSLTGCDIVQFPGANPDTSDRNAAPPPPPTEPVNPLPISDDVLEEVTSGTNTDVAPPAEDTTALEDTTTAADNAPATSETDTGAEFADVTDLLTINTARCAPSSEDTFTLAEVAGAQPAADSAFTPQTVNGTPVTAADFPGIVKMEPRRELASGGVSSGHCGATRIAETWFVTAAHCLDNTYDEIRLIATNSSLRNPAATRVEATASLCHASYGGSSGQYANDVALVKVSSEAAEALQNVPIARFGATQSPLSPATYPTVSMAGWGLTGFNGNLSDTLLSAELAMVASGPAAITVASQENAGPCIGDSGGPLQVIDTDGNPTVVGVLSVVEQNRATGEFCSGDYNARYTNLQGYVDWIESVMSVCESNFDLCAR